MGREGDRGSPSGHAGASQLTISVCRSTVRTAAWTAAGVAVTLAVVLLLLPLSGTTLLQQLTAPSEAHSFADRCSKLPGFHGQLCSAYSQAVGEDRWAVASAWQQASPASYICAGLSMECLQQDLSSSAAGSSCTPLRDGSQCAANGKRCKRSFCGGKPAGSPVGQSEVQALLATLQQQQQQQQRQQEEDEATLAAGSVANSSTAMQLQTQQQQQQQRDADAPVARMLGARWSYSQKYNLDKPIGAWPTATVSVSSGPLGKRVTDTFLATSHEYLRVGDYGDERIVSAWANIFKMLSPSPVVRVGGASQDKMTRVPGDNVWIALKKFRDATNCRFILGLPLFPKNSIGMSQKIMAQSRKYLGDSVIGYELGNEPEFWPNGLGGWGSDGKWKAGFEAYAQWFHKVALAINPCGSKKMLSGPGWGNVNTQPVSWLARILYQGKECYLRELNVHFYPYINNETVTATQLLSQPLQDFGVSKYKDYQRIGTKERLGIRISETNSLYGGGRPSLSDTLVGALWVADALFAFSDAGAVGFHLHWGIGGHPTEALGQPNTGVQTNYAYNVRPKEPPLPYPSVHAPWYGYLFWTIAAAGDYGMHADANFVPVWVQNRGRCSANMKIWALKADMGDLRMALLNKDEARNCNVRLIVDPQYCKKAGILTRLLPGPEGIFSKGMITWQGQTYEGSGLTGKIQGSKAVQQLMPVKTKDGKRCKFEVPVPSASGAILAAKWSR